MTEWDSDGVTITNGDFTFGGDDDHCEDAALLEMVYSPVPNPSLLPTGFPPSVMQTYSSSCSLVSSEDEGEEEEDEDDENNHASPRLTKRIRRSPPSTGSPPSPSARSEFASFYKRSVRQCAAEHEGTFEMDAGFELQFLSKIQPIPNRLVCRFKMFGEVWLSAINYVRENGSTVLEFTVTHVESQAVTAVVETCKEAELRHKSVKPRTICNRVFLLALGKCHQYLAALPRSAPDKTQRLASVSSSNKTRKCTESISLFGLRSGFMKDLCDAFLALG